LVNSNLFSISEPMKLILNVSILLTFFLTFFFLLNLKPNPVPVVKSRIRRLRESFFGQLGDDKTVQEKAKLVLELEQRQDEIYSQLKRGIRLNRKLEASLNNIIDKSWEEILVYLKVSSGHELASIQPAKTVAKKAEERKAEEVDVIDELETLEAEEVDTITEAEPIEEIEEVEAVEEIEEAEAVEELEEIEEIETIESAEPSKKTKKAEKTNIIDVALRAAMEPEEEPNRKGLIGRASKIRGKKSSASTASAGKGLLGKASKKSTAKKNTGKGLLANAGEIKKPKGKGLLAQADEHKQTARRGKGLLAYADEIGAVDNDEETPDINIDLDVVSPFSSMFSSLSKKE